MQRCTQRWRLDRGVAQALRVAVPAPWHGRLVREAAGGVEDEAISDNPEGM